MRSLRLLRVQIAPLYGKPSAILETPLIGLLPLNFIELVLEN